MPSLTPRAHLVTTQATLVNVATVVFLKDLHESLEHCKDTMGMGPASNMIISRHLSQQALFPMQFKAAAKAAFPVSLLMLLLLLWLLAPRLIEAV